MRACSLALLLLSRFLPVCVFLWDNKRHIVQGIGSVLFCCVGDEMIVVNSCGSTDAKKKKKKPSNKQQPAIRTTGPVSMTLPVVGPIDPSIRSVVGGRIRTLLSTKVLFTKQKQKQKKEHGFVLVLVVVVVPSVVPKTSHRKA